MHLEAIATSAAKVGSKRRGPDAADIRRAAKALIDMHGAGNALHVAARRADNAELSGSLEAARTWMQIAMAVRRWGTPASAMSARHRLH
jgi:hypothetical protein